MYRKAFLITGGSGGVGEALAYKLAKKGFRPLLGYNRNRAKAEAIAKIVDGEAIELNLIDVNAVDQVVGDLASRDVDLIGVMLGASPTLNIAPFRSISIQDMENQWRINVMGHQRLMAGLVRKVFRKRKSGIVVGMLTEAMGSPEKAKMRSMGAYIIAKYGLQGLLSVLKAEYNWLNIITVSPGYIETPMLDVFDERFLEPLRDSRQIKSPDVIGQEIADQIALLGINKPVSEDEK
jgi:NAD(P)-dependent dehydrogenase (short-subunit alcohol dehydrogenase family)